MVKQADRFGELVGDALRDEAARCHLPSDFAKRLLRGSGVSPLRPRWLKVAAMVTAMASFVVLAAVVGRVVLNAPAQDEPQASIPSDPETEAISNQGENTMIARKMATVVGASVLSVAVGATELTSEPTFVFLRPETSSFWNTATNNTMTLPIDYPMTAKSATLDVSGVKYHRFYENIVESSFDLLLPEPTSPENENVYDLTLTFDDGTVRTAKLGLIQGLSPDAEGTTRCLAPVGAGVWNQANKRAVIPIPYGTESFAVNGEVVDTGLKGAQGWYALKGRSGETYSLSLMAGGVQHFASLVGLSDGLMLIFK